MGGFLNPFLINLTPPRPPKTVFVKPPPPPASDRKGHPARIGRVARPADRNRVFIRLNGDKASNIKYAASTQGVTSAKAMRVHTLIPPGVGRTHHRVMTEDIPDPLIPVDDIAALVVPTKPRTIQHGEGVVFDKNNSVGIPADKRGSTISRRAVAV